MTTTKVLVVEDDNLARNQLKRLVAKEGFEVDVAADGTQGLERFESIHPDIVITDIKMPGIDGVELVHAVKRASPETEVIVVTGNGEYDTAIALVREGVLDYLKKPIDLDQLLASLDRAREKVEQRVKQPTYPRVLIADDDDGTRQRLCRVLAKEGWHVVQASDGAQALERFLETKIDLVLLDVKMPKMDGIEALHAMRQATDDFTAVILTGYGDEALAIKAMREGAINLLKKPIDLDRLVLAAESALEKLEAERARKYRVREIALAEQIISRITALREIVVDEDDTQVAEAFGMQVLDILPIGLVAVDAHRRVRYANEEIVRAVGYRPEHVDQHWLDALHAIGVGCPPIAELEAELDQVLSSKGGEVRRVSLGGDAFLALISLALVSGDHVEPAVAMVVNRCR